MPLSEGRYLARHMNIDIGGGVHACAQDAPCTGLRRGIGLKANPRAREAVPLSGSHVRRFCVLQSWFFDQSTAFRFAVQTIALALRACACFHIDPYCIAMFHHIAVEVLCSCSAMVCCALPLYGLLSLFYIFIEWLYCLFNMHMIGSFYRFSICLCSLLILAELYGVLRKFNRFVWILPDFCIL